MNWIQLPFSCLHGLSRAHGRRQKQEDLLVSSNRLNRHTVRTRSLLSFQGVIHRFPTCAEAQIHNSLCCLVWCLRYDLMSCFEIGINRWAAEWKFIFGGWTLVSWTWYREETLVLCLFPPAPSWEVTVLQCRDKMTVPGRKAAFHGKSTFHVYQKRF